MRTYVVPGVEEEDARSAWSRIWPWILGALLGLLLVAAVLLFIKFVLVPIILLPRSNPSAVPTQVAAQSTAIPMPGNGNQYGHYGVTDTTQGGCESKFPIALVAKAADVANARAEIQKHGPKNVCVVVFEGITSENSAHAALGRFTEKGLKIEIAFVDLTIQPDGKLEPNPPRMAACPWGKSGTVLNVYRSGTLVPDQTQVTTLCK